MHVVVVGATGNIGTALLTRLEAEPLVTSILGVARRPPAPGALGNLTKVRWHGADISTDDLDFVAGADAVVHLAWLIQPSRDEPRMRATNVDGSRRLLDSITARGVPALIYSSSLGAYAPAPKGARFDERWPATGVPSSTYSRYKAAVEALLDDAEVRHPELRIVRIRPSLVVQRGAASEIHRLFLGPLAPWHLPRWLRLVPRLPALRTQLTHAGDVAAALQAALLSDVHGAFNIAAEPPLDPRRIAKAVNGHLIPVPQMLIRIALAVSYTLRLHPVEPGWFDMGLQTPLMDTTRARQELGWQPSRTSVEALLELLDGIGDGAGLPTPALAPRDAAP